MTKLPIDMNGLLTNVGLNILQLGSYDVSLGMDWLENHRAKVDCYKKVDYYKQVLECIDERRKCK